MTAGRSGANLTGGCDLSSRGGSLCVGPKLPFERGPGLNSLSRWRLARCSTERLTAWRFVPHWSSAMPSSKEYRQRAEECLKLASSATDHYVKVALAELAQEFKETAEDLERPS